MIKIEIDKTEFLSRVQANRDNHRAVFEKAQEGYKAFLIEELEKRLEEVRRNRPIDRIIRLVEPNDHTDDYDAIILQAQLSTGDTVELTNEEFRSYVMDDWGWKQDWSQTVSSYGVTP